MPEAKEILQKNPLESLTRSWKLVQDSRKSWNQRSRVIYTQAALAILVGSASIAGSGASLKAEAASPTSRAPYSDGVQEPQGGSPQVEEATGSEKVTTVYEIQSGDTLSEVAQRFGLTVETLAAANKINNPDLIYPGQALIVPNVVGAEGEFGRGGPTIEINNLVNERPLNTIFYKSEFNDTLGVVAGKFGVSPDQIIKENSLSIESLLSFSDESPPAVQDLLLKPETELAITTDAVYIIQPGESLQEVSLNTGVSLPLLAAMNKFSYREGISGLRRGTDRSMSLEDPKMIKTDDQLTLPKEDSELELKDQINLKASDEWDEETTNKINEMGREAIYLLDKMRLIDGYKIPDTGEITIYKMPKEMTRSFGYGIVVKGLWQSEDHAEVERNRRFNTDYSPPGIYLNPVCLEDNSFTVAVIVHELVHNCRFCSHELGYEAFFKVILYFTWLNGKEVPLIE